MRYWHDQQASPLMEKLCQEEDFMRAERAVYKVSRDYKKYIRNMFEVRWSMDRAQDLLDARKEGLAEGKAEGHAEGLAEGKEKGQAENSLAIARKMKAMGDSVERIHAITDLSIETIEQL